MDDAHVDNSDDNEPNSDRDEIDDTEFMQEWASAAEVDSYIFVQQFVKLLPFVFVCSFLNQVSLYFW